MPQPYLNQLSEQVAWSPSDSVRDRPMMGAFMGERATLLVEAGASPAHARQFLGGLADLSTQRPIARPQYAALTHWHWDHVFGAATLNLPTIGHVETRRRVQEMARLDWRDHALDARVAAGLELPFIADHVKVEMTSAERGALVIAPPDITFTDQVEVDLGGLTVIIQHVGGDHSPDSSVIYSPEARVAFLGDCFYNGFIGPSGRFYTTNRLLPLLDTLEALPADYFIMSHHEAPTPRAEFLTEVTLLRQIAALVERYGADRSAILAAIPAVLKAPLNADHQEIVDEFLLGLQSDII